MNDIEIITAFSSGLVFLGLCGYITQSLVNKYGAWFPWETKMKEWAKQNPKEMNSFYKKHGFSYREREED